MSLQGVWGFAYEFGGLKPVQIEVSEAPLTSDAGLLPVRQFDERIGFTGRLAAAIGDRRDPNTVDHTVRTMLRQRVYGMLAGYEDQNDHDTLRHDPVFQLICDKTPVTCRDGTSPRALALASQPTLSRFENAVTIADLKRLRDVMVDQFIQSFDKVPARITLDVDAFDDPCHGQQQLEMFNGFYDQHQYLPIAFTCAENDLVVFLALRFGSCTSFLGADDDLRYLARRLRAVWPDVEIVLRGDSGFGNPTMYNVCDELRITYTFGIGMNPVLKKMSDELLETAVAQFEATQQPQRLFQSQMYQAGSWPAARRTIIKCEANALGTNRRAVVTNRPGAETLIQPVYDEYAERGESENRNKELKRGLCADRLSDHRFLANYFRLQLHAFALNLLVLLRRTVRETLTPQMLSQSNDLPADRAVEALAGPERPRYFNRRRDRDPLGEGHIETWRTRLIKVAAEVIVSARRIVVRLAPGWPHLHHFAAVSQAVLNLPAIGTQ